jgi:hypothetical protein
MRLDYIENTDEYGDDMVRLYDFNREESVNFHRFVKDFLDSGENQINLTEVDFIEPRNCTLVFCITGEDEGIVTDDGVNFYCNLTRKGFLNMVSLLEPFCKRETSGYQYLYDIDSPTDFLFSPAGTWQ